MQLLSAQYVKAKNNYGGYYMRVEGLRSLPKRLVETFRPDQDPHATDPLAFIPYGIKKPYMYGSEEEAKNAGERLLQYIESNDLNKWRGLILECLDYGRSLHEGKTGQGI